MLSALPCVQIVKRSAILRPPSTLLCLFVTTLLCLFVTTLLCLFVTKSKLL
jgi:hypothetical protein